MVEARTFPTIDIRGVNTILLRDGSEIRLEDIQSSEQGRAILDEIDGAILAIEDQIALGFQSDDPSWKVRAEIALKRKRRSRPALQARIGELRRAEKALAIKDTHANATSKVDAKRQAFVHAAYELLGHETCVEVWALAQEKQPALFTEGGSS
ncbi:hypothetical protein [Methylobacterium marchantiae]|uniref:Uncharacterized protein n=1 Tax=Methylobacterium marchantiae TaxID=600331 RepID=A0ABW3X3S8_9HYPH|nr:hypothetical protein AIGOOFII_4293 [Methylobacterium marchantiae]